MLELEKFNREIFILGILSFFLNLIYSGFLFLKCIYRFNKCFEEIFIIIVIMFFFKF